MRSPLERIGQYFALPLEPVEVTVREAIVVLNFWLGMWGHFPLNRKERRAFAFAVRPRRKVVFHQGRVTVSL